MHLTQYPAVRTYEQGSGSSSGLAGVESVVYCCTHHQNSLYAGVAADRVMSEDEADWSADAVWVVLSLAAAAGDVVEVAAVMMTVADAVVAGLAHV